MIQLVHRNQLDVLKYDTCILEAAKSRIYAFSWYLDIVADNWSVLVLDDYQAVMPLPWRSKYFIKYIYTPCWVQQLGVFSLRNIEEKQIEEFVENVPNRFKKVTLLTNVSGFKNIDCTIRDNYILNLEASYEEIFKKYKKNRKQAINKIHKNNNLRIEEVSIDRVIELFKDNYYDKKKIITEDYVKLKILVEGLVVKSQVEVYGVFTEKSKLISGAVFLKDSYRITYLFSASTLEGKKNESSTLLIDNMIQKYCNSELIFDFEGSMIPGVASFFRSFNASLESYSEINRRW
jgi:lipid II:glycine glycyltransferase (peptidoglycan interpeptide bridge formation enzyme)